MWCCVDQVEELRKEVEERRAQREGRLRYVREQHDKRAAEREKEKKEAQSYFTPEARSTAHGVVKRT